MDLHERIASLRVLGADVWGPISQREASRVAGLDGSTVGMIERHKSGTSTGTASKLAKAFGVSLDWLIDGKGARPDKALVRAAYLRACARRGK